MIYFSVARMFQMYHKLPVYGGDYYIRIFNHVLASISINSFLLLKNCLFDKEVTKYGAVELSNRAQNECKEWIILPFLESWKIIGS